LTIAAFQRRVPPPPVERSPPLPPPPCTHPAVDNVIAGLVVEREELVEYLPVRLLYADELEARVELVALDALLRLLLPRRVLELLRQGQQLIL
jgi:hypothetical protein